MKSLILKSLKDIKKIDFDMMELNDKLSLIPEYKNKDIENIEFISEYSNSQYLFDESESLEEIGLYMINLHKEIEDKSDLIIYILNPSEDSFHFFIFNKKFLIDEFIKLNMNFYIKSIK